MKKIFLAISCLMLNLSVIAQPKPDIKGDSLLYLLKHSEDAFTVLNKLDLYKVDYFDCYNNQNIKPYVLKWIDFEAYFNHKNTKALSRSFDEDYKSYKVKGWLKNHKQSHLVDTVLNTPELFNSYLDSVYLEVTNSRRHSFFQKNERYLDRQALLFFMKYRIPEAYTIIRQYWSEDGFSIKSPYFKVMLSMHDSLAIKKYSDYLDTIVKNRDYLKLRREVQQVVNEYDYGSVCVDFKLKLLKVQHVIPNLMFDSGDGGIDSPYNLVFLHPFIVDYFFFKSENPVVKSIIAELYSLDLPILNMSLKELKKISNKIVVNYSEFEKVALEYKNKLEKKEEYWKVNIPYIK